ncbi:hypothetical protein [Parasegetibacter sp. NRK P23]|uniref:hypothetical protein n=1 Tax=Parasegetibacter sp. NRK P23 TaxID=2942999 RepID=UPI002043CC82|nr:hypothetical protein [Parasegetibacter sp. NRK P23]MCM5530308.1 hypothetical protein [Parasegetibacter sp. NRK P23]
MNFRQQIAKYVTGNLTKSQLPSVGMIGLEEGFDSPSLRILAGLGESESSFVIDYYFEFSLKELNIILPDRRQAAIDYAMALVDEILCKNIDVIDGTKEILQKAINSYDFFSESEKYCYDSIGFEAAYGLYDLFNELSDNDYPLRVEENLDLKIETRDSLLAELKRWVDKLKNCA